MVFAASLMAVGARDGGAARKRPGGKSLRSRIRAAEYTAVKPDTGIRQRRLRAAANSTADQRVNLQRTQNARRAPWPLPLVSTTSEETILPSSTS